MYLSTRLALLLLCVGTGAACGSSVPITVDDPLAPDIFLSSDVTERNRIFQETELVFQDQVASCVRAEGFDYFAVDDTAEMTAANSTFTQTVGERADELSIGLVDRDFAREHGYGIALRYFRRPSDVTGQRVDRNVEYIDTLNASDLEAYSNVLGNCEREADTNVFSELIELEDIAQEIAIEVHERLIADGSILSLQERWSSCMAAEGVESIVDFIPATPLDLVIAMEEMSYDGFEAMAIGDADGYWADFRSVEQQVAMSAVDCAEAEEYSKVVLETRQALMDEELALRGYG